VGLLGGIDFRLAEWEKFLGWVLVSVIPLMPVVLFYSFAGKGYASRVACGLIGVLLVHFGLLLMSGVFGLVSVGSMRVIGVSENISRDYLVDGRQYPKNIFDLECWDTEGRSDYLYLLKAFSLYHFGAVNLLCPVSLSGADIRRIGQHTRVCIPFRDDAIRKLGVVREGDVDRLTADEGQIACLGEVVNPKSKNANSTN